MKTFRVIKKDLLTDNKEVSKCNKCIRKQYREYKKGIRRVKRNWYLNQLKEISRKCYK